MKKIWSIAVLGIIALTSCESKIDLPGDIDAKPDASATVFTATTESAVTKTALDGNYNVLWQNGDMITIVDGASNVGVYSTTSTTTQGEFTKVSGDMADTPSYTAYYPSTIYNGGTLTLPAEQTYVAENITGAPMMAVSSTTSLIFKNLGGIICLNLSTSLPDISVASISLNATQPMSGPITNVEALSSETPVAATVSGTAGVTLNCGAGVAISSTPKPFYIAVPAGTYSSLKITVTTTDGKVQTRTSNKGIEVGRSQITNITLGFNAISATTGSAEITGGGSQEWVQLWPGGPKWAKFNIGSTITSYAGVTEYTTATIGGYYSYRGRYDSQADANGTDNTAKYIWGSNWATPTGEMEQALLTNCNWTYCDGSSIQYVPGCTLAGWKIEGKEAGYTENSIFLPLSGIRDQNNSARETVGTRGCYWSADAEGSGAYFINLTATAHDYVSANQPHGLSVRAICVDNRELYTDLSATESANTYIVSAAGTYRFKATVKGNGGLDPLTGTTATTINPADIAGVKVLWELYNDNKTGKSPVYHTIKYDSAYDISYSNGYVTFSTPESFKEGAACVAIYDNSDNILWSWLIWATAEPGTVTHNGKTFMDKNLGATSRSGYSTNYVRGFLFQWGRKDAFTACAGTDNYSVYYYTPLAENVFTEYPTEVKSMAYTIAHPTARIVCKTEAIHSWMPESEYSLRPWRENVKTIYDPCPPGWRVPTKKEIDGITGLPDTGLYNSSSNSNNLRHFGNSDKGYYWTSTISDDSNLPGNAYAFCNDGRNLNNWSQAEGYAIRPVRE